MGLIAKLLAPETTTYAEIGSKCLGHRIRFHEPPALQEKWKAMFPLVEWFPSKGDTGVVVELPGALGGGPRVRWDNGKEAWIGREADFELLD